MSKEDPPSSNQQQSNEGNGEKSFHANNLSLVVGDSGSSSSEEEMQDMRSRMQSFAINMGDEGMPDSTIFVEDSEVIAPSTSLIEQQQNNDLQQQSDLNIDNFVRDIFANDTKFLQSAVTTEDDANVIEEIFTEKPPKILKGYLFGNVIGEGSYSKVKEVLHVHSLIRRAIKIIKDKRLRKIPGGEQNVQREIDVLRRLNHSNVVKVVDIFRIEEKQKLYIVMEYCVCSLQQLLDNCDEKLLPEFQAHLYFVQLLDGLDFLHGKRIIHKDIKPGNLLLSLDGILKICDLGVAELLSPSSCDDWCTLVQGTPKFQPPEIVSGTQGKFRGCIVDIWACGVTLYNMVSGEYPFEGDVIMKLFENIINYPLHMPLNIKLSIDLEQLLQGMLKKEPELRWNSMRIRASKWFLHKHIIDDKLIVHVPAVKDVPAHRPLGVFPYLEQLYSSSIYYDDETVESNKDDIDDEDIDRKIIQECQGQCSSMKLDNLITAATVPSTSTKDLLMSSPNNNDFILSNTITTKQIDSSTLNNWEDVTNEHEPFLLNEKKKKAQIQFIDNNNKSNSSNIIKKDNTKVSNLCYNNNENGGGSSNECQQIINNSREENEQNEGNNNLNNENSCINARRQQQQQRVKINIARLRQVLFIALCLLIVLSSIILLVLML